MHVIITGGTGLIGRALASDLISDGHQVTALSRSPDRASSMPEGVRIARWDARSALGWGNLVDGADAIVNLAGATIARPWSKRYKQVIRESRLSAARAVVEAVTMATSKPHALIQASGIGYYGPRGDNEVTVDTPAGEDFLGQFAVAWEASTAAVEELGVRRAIIRSGAVLSTAGGALPLQALPFRLLLGGSLGSGKQWLPWIHIDDQVRAIRFLIENDAASGPFNLVAPETITNADFSRVLGRVLKRPSWIPVPAFALRTLLGEMSIVMLEGQRATPKRLQNLGFTFHFPKAEDALRDLLAK
jgi:uncharacterized protein (TIGR01777 family)